MRFIGDRCETCHERLFQRVQDTACVECHRTTHDHIMPARLALTELGPTPRCATCHREHNEPQTFLVNSGDGMCVDCHGDPAEGFGQIKLDRVLGFGLERHPEFKPHLLAFRQGQKLQVTSSDPVGHNTNMTPFKNQPWNQLLPSAAEGSKSEIAGPDLTAEPRPIKVQCNVHNWMGQGTVDQVFAAFRGGFLGKVSPVHFFWGSFDLAVTRFSGRAAPPPPSNPMIPDGVNREAYSHEVSSCGFWPGNGGLGQAAFYCYAYPQPDSFADAAIGALSLAIAAVERGEWVLVDEALHEPLEQALMVVTDDPSRVEAARTFAELVNAPAGREVMRRFGFVLPGEEVGGG